MNYTLLLFVVSVLIYSAFKETGPRAGHGNFGWAIGVGYYILFLYIVPWFFQSMQKYRIQKAQGERTTLVSFIYGTGLFVFSWHLISGLWYFEKLIKGDHFFQ